MHYTYICTIHYTVKNLSIANLKGPKDFVRYRVFVIYLEGFKKEQNFTETKIKYFT